MLCKTQNLNNLRTNYPSNGVILNHQKSVYIYIMNLQIICYMFLLFFFPWLFYSMIWTSRSMSQYITGQEKRGPISTPQTHPATNKLETCKFFDFWITRCPRIFILEKQMTQDSQPQILQFLRFPNLWKSQGAREFLKILLSRKNQTLSVETSETQRYEIVVRKGIHAPRRSSGIFHHFLLRNGIIGGLFH